MKKEDSNKNRHPTEKLGQKPTPPDPLLSCGKKEVELLRYLFNTQNARFNIKEYARINKIPRSSVYEILNRLETKGLAERLLGDNKISKQGKIYLETTNRVSEKGVGNSRRGCREINKLSTHYHKFKLPILDKKNFRIEKINKLNHKGFKENKLSNLHQIIIDFEDAKVIINPKQVIISLFEVLTNSVEESDIKSLSRILDYEKILRKIGIITEGVMTEEGHWARMQSALSDFISEKVDNRYFLKLEDGSKFWIDHSNGKQEDETDNKLVRTRIDNFFNQVGTMDVDLKDLDKMKETIGMLIKLESMKAVNSSHLPNIKPNLEKFKSPEYVR
jgi:predicted transcriptional regulator